MDLSDEKDEDIIFKNRQNKKHAKINGDKWLSDEETPVTPFKPSQIYS